MTDYSEEVQSLTRAVLKEPNPDLVLRSLDALRVANDMAGAHLVVHAYLAKFSLKSLTDFAREHRSDYTDVLTWLKETLLDQKSFTKGELAEMGRSADEWLESQGLPARRRRIPWGSEID